MQTNKDIIIFMATLLVSYVYCVNEITEETCETLPSEIHITKGKVETTLTRAMVNTCCCRGI